MEFSAKKLLITVWAFGLISQFSFSPTMAQAVIYEIEAQPLASALTQFARQANLSINYSGMDISSVYSLGTSRHVSKSVSLRTLLRGTGVGFRFTDVNTLQLYWLPAEREDEQSIEKPSIENMDRADFIEELRVTAIKRPSTSFKLPVSVSGITALALQDLGSYDFQSLAPHLAGVSTTNLGPGRNKIFVRGLSDGPFSDRTQAVVGVYIDETPVNFSDTNPDIRLFDVERVELIRGPQGTLYGAGSLGGIYKIITKKPELDVTRMQVRASASRTEGAGENALFDVLFNTPIVANKLGFRLTGYVDVRDGYIDDTALQLENVNDLAIYGARPALRWKIASDWTLDAVFNLQSIRYDDTQYFQRTLGRNNRANVLQEPYDDDFIHGSLTLSGKVGSATLTSATAYVDRKIEEITDASNGLTILSNFDDFPVQPPELGTFAQISGVGEFFADFRSNAAGYFVRNDIVTLSHETRLQSETGQQFDWLLGVFYLRREQETNTLLAIAFDEREPVIAFADVRVDTTNDLALFGEASYQLTRKLSLSGGLRYSHSMLDLSFRSLIAPEGTDLTVNDDRSADKFVPKLALRYEWQENLQAYAQVSVGFRVGGINIDTPLEALIAADPDEGFVDGFQSNFQSDTLINYEIGIKSYWFDRRLSFNLSTFYVDWTDIQSDQLSEAGLPFVTNVGNARSLGYEIELTANLLKGLELRGSIFRNDSELRDSNVFLGAEQGDRLPTIPETSFSVALLYQFDFGSNWVSTISADYAYTGGSALTFDEENSPQMGDFGILNVRWQLSQDNWNFGIFAQNLTDSSANTFSFGNNFTVLDGNQVTPPRPRTIGIFVERSF